MTQTIPVHEDLLEPAIRHRHLNSNFDPLRDLLDTQRARPKHLENINLRTLEPFQRALLATDGTVTKFLEAYFLEPVEVTLLKQETQTLQNEQPWLELPVGENVVIRQVLLRGRYSTTVYAYAVSLLALNRLPDSLLQDLAVEPSGIGRVLLNSQIENRRDILWYGREHLTNFPEELECYTGSDFISRTYRIVTNHAPVMLINEKFPTPQHM